MDTETIKKRVTPVLSRYGAEEAYVFGSAARGEAGPGSDIDILARFGKLGGLFRYMRIKHELEEALGSRVDLVQMEALRPEYRQSVEKERVRLL